MPEYFIPKKGSKGNSYHTVDHGRDNLISATEEQVREAIRKRNLTACGHCLRNHGMVKLDGFDVPYDF